MKKIILLLFISSAAYTQQLAPLSVEKIMRDPKWMGVAPTNLNWSEDGKQLYFNWNPDKNPGDSLYSISLANKTPQKVSAPDRRSLPSTFGNYNRTHTKKLYEKNGDLFLLDILTGKSNQITNTLDRESNAVFSLDEKKIVFNANSNLFSWEISSGAFAQLTDFKKGIKKADTKLSEQEKWLKADQLAYIEVLKQRSDNKKTSEKMQKADRPKRPKEIYLDEKNVDNIQLSPDQKYITYRLSKNANPKSTIVPNYVTESGFAEDISARTKVGATQNASEFFVYDILKDTVYCQ
jgi:Tol biopolymer transport system component